VTVLPDGVYLLSSAADTAISRLIRFFTGGRHSHLSVVFLQDGELRAHSFARRRWSTPIDGAFVEEGRERYTYGGGRCKEIAFYTISPELQRRIRARLARLRPEFEDCTYNLLDALASGVGLRVRSKVAHTCVSYTSLIVGLERRSDMTGPRDVLVAVGAKPVYRGPLEGLERLAGARFWDGDSVFYLEPLPPHLAFTRSVSSQARAVSRILASSPRVEVVRRRRPGCKGRSDQG
jgi:hypothetical protein